MAKKLPISVLEDMAQILAVDQEDTPSTDRARGILTQFILAVGLDAFKDIPDRKQGRLSDSAYVTLYDAYRTALKEVSEEHAT